MPQPTPCPHLHSRLIAKDRDAEYRECIDCGEIFEPPELTEPAGFDESLSDA